MNPQRNDVIGLPKHDPPTETHHGSSGSGASIIDNPGNGKGASYERPLQKETLH